MFENGEALERNEERIKCLRVLSSGNEFAIPVKPEVAAACEMLGFDPLYVANEGKLIAIVEPGVADQVLSVMKNHSLGVNAAIIGSVTGSHASHVMLKTRYGTTRLIDMLSGEMLPRIC